LSLLSKQPSSRPTPIQSLHSFWFDGKNNNNHVMLFTDADTDEFVSRMKACLKMSPLEQVLRRAVAKKVRGKNDD